MPACITEVSCVACHELLVSTEGTGFDDDSAEEAWVKHECGQRPPLATQGLIDRYNDWVVQGFRNGIITASRAAELTGWPLRHVLRVSREASG